MLLSKQVAVSLNIVHFKFKQFVAETLKEYGFNITPEQFLVLDVLWDDKVGKSQQQIANLLMKDKNSIRKLLDGLEGKGLITRIPDKDDRRINIVRLTDKAATISARVQEVAEQAVENMIEDIDESEINVFLEVLKNMSEKIDSLTHRKNLQTENGEAI